MIVCNSAHNLRAYGCSDRSAAPVGIASMKAEVVLSTICLDLAAPALTMLSPPPNLTFHSGSANTLLTALAFGSTPHLSHRSSSDPLVAQLLFSNVHSVQVHAALTAPMTLAARRQSLSVMRTAVPVGDVCSLSKSISLSSLRLAVTCSAMAGRSSEHVMIPAMRLRLASERYRRSRGDATDGTPQQDEVICTESDATSTKALYQCGSVPNCSRAFVGSFASSVSQQ
eukprot:3185375-Rhodomonas_salina.1